MSASTRPRRGSSTAAKARTRMERARAATSCLSPRLTLIGCSVSAANTLTTRSSLRRLPTMCSRR